jgi:hypothetical protein
MPQIQNLFGILLWFAVPAIGLVLLQLAIAIAGVSTLGIIQFARSAFGRPTGSS